MYDQDEFMSRSTHDKEYISAQSRLSFYRVSPMSARSCNDAVAIAGVIVRGLDGNR